MMFKGGKMEWIIVVGGFAIGIIGGYFLGHSANDNTGLGKEVEAELQGVQEELNLYRQEVTHHFSRTAELFNAMTSDYRSLYQHLADGAQKFCAADAQLPDSMAKLEPLVAQDAVSEAEVATESGEQESAEVSASSGDEEVPVVVAQEVGLHAAEETTESSAVAANAETAAEEPGGGNGKEPVTEARQQEAAGNNTAPSIERLQDGVSKKTEQPSFTVKSSAGENEQRLH